MFTECYKIKTKQEGGQEKAGGREENIKGHIPMSMEQKGE